MAQLQFQSDVMAMDNNLDVSIIEDNGMSRYNILGSGKWKGCKPYHIKNHYQFNIQVII
jgi:hypothetical protein